MSLNNKRKRIEPFDVGLSKSRRLLTDEDIDMLVSDDDDDDDDEIDQTPERGDEEPFESFFSERCQIGTDERKLWEEERLLGKEVPFSRERRENGRTHFSDHFSERGRFGGEGVAAGDSPFLGPSFEKRRGGDLYSSLNIESHDSPFLMSTPPRSSPSPYPPATPPPFSSTPPIDRNYLSSSIPETPFPPPPHQKSNFGFFIGLICGIFIGILVSFFFTPPFAPPIDDFGDCSHPRLLCYEDDHF
eukprot:CAMPEP_0201475942 /NCGR_PEP_ID=MMETSP0151_2-20130828/1245_1 /ASSEMBLY_ACC=CAM_ASM_000257 /TAXON_ID=200890 /ORGANISM="Paramoeba atlantica, Strain 621/1 / CCAP 1560/9" /LENGTH=244 /DNA_ID=CAMNT_0047856157 /DNA_START=843 /DNA_END=1577 /DNA_ORIENTATION=+